MSHDIVDTIHLFTFLDYLGYQGQLHSAETKRKYSVCIYKNRKVIEHNVQLTKEHYINFQNVHLCFPLKFKSAGDNDNGIAAGFLHIRLRKLISRDMVMIYLFYH